MPGPEPHLRAADVDRTAVATSLGEHMSAGRLTLAEYDERVSRAYAALTYGELAELTADLPSTGRSRSTGLPVPQQAASSGSTSPGSMAHGSTSPGSMCAPGRVRHGGHMAHGGRGRSRSNASWRSWLSTSLIVVSIWLATSISAGGAIYFWPIWVIVPWGAVLLAGRLTGGREDDGDDRRQLQA